MALWYYSSKISKSCPMMYIVPFDIWRICDLDLFHILPWESFFLTARKSRGWFLSLFGILPSIHKGNKGSLTPEGIFNFVSSSKKCAKSLYTPGDEYLNKSIKSIYCTCAIITRGLYIFTPFLKSISLFSRRFFSENSVLIYG